MESLKFFFLLASCAVVFASFFYGGLLFRYRFVLEDAVNHAARIAVTRGIRGGLWIDPRSDSYSNSSTTQNGDFFVLLGKLLDNGSLIDGSQNSITLPESLVFPQDIESVTALNIYRWYITSGVSNESETESGDVNIDVKLHVGHLLAISLANLYIRQTLGPGVIAYPCTDDVSDSSGSMSDRSNRSCIVCYVSLPLRLPCAREDPVEIPPETFRLICTLRPNDIIFRFFVRLTNFLVNGSDGDITASALVSYPTGLSNPWSRLQ